MEAKIFVPPDFYCPITGELINEPLTDPEGHTYEESQILQWLSTNQTSPVTRSTLLPSQLKKNIAMKRSIESIRERLTEDQLRIDSRVSEEAMVPFISALDHI